MNERINELLVEAHKQTSGGIYTGHLSEWTEKFATLVIRECAEVAGCNSHVSGFTLGDLILEHWGVTR